jgi:glycosyltransferase involved in cell wall biosynthesis
MKKTVLILGKIPPPYFGPAIATSILLNSELKNKFKLLHLDTRAYKDIHMLGKWNFSKIIQNISIYKQLYKILKEQHPDLVLIPISQTTIGFIKDSFFIVVCAIMRTKVLIQLRGSNFKKWVDHSNLINKLYVKTILGFTEGVIVLGQKLRYLFEDYFNRENIYVAPNGADYIIPKQANHTKGVVRIVYLANLQPSKGILDVIDATAIINSSIDAAFRLDVIGNWRDEKTRQYCENRVKENNLPVHFHGPLSGDNKLQFLSDADIFIFPPREPEGHPWVIVEAMACGLPIISTDRGAITESVINNRNGFIVDVNSAQQIADNAIKLIENTTLRHQMGKASQVIYDENFNESSLVRNYSDVFSKVLKKSTKGL